MYIFRRFLPIIIFIGINILIFGGIILLESSKSVSRVVTDENGNEYTLGVEESDQSSRQINIGDKAPDFTLTTYDGKVVQLKNLYEEKPVILQFWATWCGICEEEFPENNTFAKKNKDKFHFVAVNWAESSTQVETYIKRVGLDPTAIIFLMNENSDVIHAYGVRETPTHAVVDTKGNIQFYNIGYTTTKQFSSVIDSI